MERTDKRWLMSVAAEVELSATMEEGREVEDGVATDGFRGVAVRGVLLPSRE